MPSPTSLQARAAWRLLDRLAPALQRGRRLAGLLPLTPGGIGLFALAGSGFWFLGVLRKDLTLLPASAALGLLGLLMVASVGAGAALLARAWRGARLDDPILRLEAGCPRPTGLALRLLPLPFIEPGWSWISPPGVEVGLGGGWRELVEEVTPSRRCLLDGITREIVVRDVLGVARVRWRVERPSRVMILPSRGALERVTALHSLIGGEEDPDPFGDPMGDRVEMRQYAPGDPSRTILWKVYARNRRLMVRIPERALTSRPRTCAYLVAGPSDEASAAVARVVLESRTLGDAWRFGADGSQAPCVTLEAALEALARSGNPTPKPCGLAAFLRQAEADGFRSCLVFLPAAPGPWMEEVRRASASSHLTLRFLTAVDRASDSLASPGLWERLLLRPLPGGGSDLGAVLSGLALPAPLVLLERTTGRIVEDARHLLVQSGLKGGPGPR